MKKFLWLLFPLGLWALERGVVESYLGDDTKVSSVHYSDGWTLFTLKGGEVVAELNGTGLIHNNRMHTYEEITLKVLENQLNAFETGLKQLIKESPKVGYTRQVEGKPSLFVFTKSMWLPQIFENKEQLESNSVTIVVLDAPPEKKRISYMLDGKEYLFVGEVDQQALAKLAEWMEPYNIKKPLFMSIP